MKQLKMIRIGTELREHPLPEGYSYELFDGSEAAISDWLSICSNGLTPNTDRIHFQKCILEEPSIVPCRDLFFVVDRNGKRVATSTCTERAESFGGVHMVAALPECRGLGIGHCLITHTVRLLTERGYDAIGLTTDDFRLAAVKVYLDAGFCPYLWQDSESDMKKRWTEVIATLGYKGKIEFIEEQDKYNP